MTIYFHSGHVGLLKISREYVDLTLRWVFAHEKIKQKKKKKHWDVSDKIIIFRKSVSQYH